MNSQFKLNGLNLSISLIIHVLQYLNQNNKVIREAEKLM